MIVIAVIPSCDDENIINADSAVIKTTQNLKLTSENGFKIAKSIKDLKQRYRLNMDVEITSIIFKESEDYKTALINYKNIDGSESNFAVVRGLFKLKANKLERSIENTVKSLVLDTTWVVTCSGCENCGVRMTIDPDDNIEYSCGYGQTCCVMKITKTTSLEP
jgi:hypothetical protein